MPRPDVVTTFRGLTHWPRVLFALKHRESPWVDDSTGPDRRHHSGNPMTGQTMGSGLRNSVHFVVGMLRSIGVTADVVEVRDNNDIDREVAAHRPSHVVIEALWVVPEKFEVLKPLHPNVAWVVRNHSQLPFLANEGIAIQWITGYLARNVEVMCNSPRAVEDVRELARAFCLPDRLVTCGPNFYPIADTGPAMSRLDRSAPVIRVGCFGAVRPLKNHLTQAIAAIAFARSLGKRLEFHVNGTRVEGSGEPVLKNLRAMFEGAHDAKLIEHGWLDHEEFLKLVSAMDAVMQVSFTETFNIVGADAAAAGVPLIASCEVPWLGEYGHADPTSVASMVAVLTEVWSEPAPLVRLCRQRRDLHAYGRQSESVWRQRLGIRPAPCPILRTP
jgi:glycosyltransferase involved in cell wall biosynthesis